MNTYAIGLYKALVWKGYNLSDWAIGICPNIHHMNNQQRAANWSSHIRPHSPVQKYQIVDTSFRHISVAYGFWLLLLIFNFL